MLAFVTVGSTRFDALVQAALSEQVLSALKQKGYTDLVLQCGDSDFDIGQALSREQTRRIAVHGLEVEIWRFQPSLQETFERSDLVISHAGSGTILDVLRLGKALIVVPNPTLLDNHQEELALALSDLGHLQSSSAGGLAQAIVDFDPNNVVPFPSFDGARFRNIIDEEMGFED